MPDERPVAVGIVGDVEHFRCLPFATTLSRESCATRFVHAAKLRRTSDGIKGPKLGEVTAAQRRLGYGRLARCRDCPVGKIHADELGTVARTGHERQNKRVEATMPKISEEMPGWAAGWRAEGLTIERARPGDPVVVGWGGKKLKAAAWGHELGISTEGFIARVRDCRAGKITVAEVFGARRNGGRPKKEPLLTQPAKEPRQTSHDAPPPVRKRDPFVEKAEAMLGPLTPEFTDAMREIRDRAQGPISPAPSVTPSHSKGSKWLSSDYSGSRGVGDRFYVQGILVSVVEIAEGGRLRVAPVDPDGWEVSSPPAVSDLLVATPGDLLRALGYDVTEMVVPAGRVLFVRADNRARDDDQRR